MSLPNVLISEHPFISPAKCNALVKRLAANSRIATDRNPAAPGTFVTYGRAAYLDVCLDRSQPETDYYSKVAATNKELSAVFGDVLERLRLFVETIAGAPAVFLPKSLALPGFHIFRGAGIRAAGDAGNHFDVQYRSLNLPSAPDPGSKPISMTILLRAPQGGTGLRVHDVSYEDFALAYQSGRTTSLEQLIARRSHSYWPYKTGSLFFHHGLVVHSLTTPGNILPNDERITMQGHGIRCGGRWILYW